MDFERNIGPYLLSFLLMNAFFLLHVFPYYIMYMYLHLCPKVRTQSLGKLVYRPLHPNVDSLYA